MPDLKTGSPAPDAESRLTTDAEWCKVEAERRIEEERRTGTNTLHLAGLGLTTLPGSLGELTTLKELSLSNNRLIELPEWMGRLTRLQGLYVFQNQLTTLPESLGQLTGLLTLILGNNRLTTVPDWMGQFVRLKGLNLMGNQLTTLPESLGKLTGLQSLDLSHNELAALPESLDQLTELEGLSIRENRLAALPESIGQLRQLEELDASYNDFTTLPESLGQLTQLKELILHGNLLMNLPESLGQLTQLTKLYLYDNQLTGLPESLRKLTKLERLYVHGNPSLGLPNEVLGPTRLEVAGNRARRKSPTEILDYYFAHRQAALETGTEPLMEAKVLVLGEASVGKSSLIAALSEGKRRQELDGKGTSGIVRKLWVAPVSGESLVNPNTRGSETLRLNLWDFGGQEIYHSAHTLFLTRRAIYLIVVSKRDNERQNNVDYWLRMAASFGGPEAVTYIVVNKCDEKVGHLPDEEALRRKYPQLRGFLKTSCDDLTGIQESREVVVREALRLEGVRLPVAKSWLSAKNALERMSDHTLSMQEWETLCGKQNVTTPEAQRELLRLCDRLGAVRYFPTKETDPSELRNTAILNPEWVTLGIYALFDDADLKKRGGLLSRTQMEQILEARKYPVAQERIIEEVMRRFDLLYDSADRGAEQRMLIPLMLPEREPAMEWPGGGTLEFVYEYDVVPAGLVPAFMARMHKRLSPAVPAWRNGCVLEHKECRVRVIGDAEAKWVSISVTGEAALRREALDKVRSTFDDLHGAVENLPVKQLIPVPGHPGAPMLDYEFVRSLEWEGTQEFPTKGAKSSTVTVNVREALDGVRGEARRSKDDEQRQALTDRPGKIVVVQDGGKFFEGEDMSKNHKNINASHGSIVGDGNKQSISASFNTQNANLTALLEVLRKELDRLPAPDAESVRPYVEAIETEAKKEKPSKNFLGLTKNGLVDAAKTCATMTPSLLKAAGAVVDWFSNH